MAVRVQQVKFGENISTPTDIKTSVPHGSGSVTSAKFIIFIFDYGSNDFKLVSVLLLMPFLYITDRKIRRICFSTLNAIQLYKNIDARWIVFTLPKLKIYTHWFQRNRFFKRFNRSYCSFYLIMLEMSMALPNRVDQSSRDVYGGSSSCAKAKQRRYVLGLF